LEKTVGVEAWVIEVRGLGACYWRFKLMILGFDWSFIKDTNLRLQGLIVALRFSFFQKVKG